MLASTTSRAKQLLLDRTRRLLAREDCQALERALKKVHIYTLTLYSIVKLSFIVKP